MSQSGTPALIAVDWGTTRFRAYLTDARGQVLERTADQAGIQNVPTGQFGQVLMEHCGHWLSADLGLPVVMAGMVGSRNGWVEAPYARCPASVADLAAAVVSLERPDGGLAFIVPGVSGVFEGAADVMRGEETLVAGIGIEDGLVCLPGTHSKWVVVRGGRIERFATFMTGESYGLYADHSILARLAVSPEESSGFAKGVQASRRSPSLTRLLFEARADVLLDLLKPAEVRPFISGLLIGHEIGEAQRMFGKGVGVALVAEGASADAPESLAGRYRSAMTMLGLAPRLHDPEAALIAGLTRMAVAWRDRQAAATTADAPPRR